MGNILNRLYDSHAIGHVDVLSELYAYQNNSRVTLFLHDVIPIELIHFYTCLHTTSCNSRLQESSNDQKD